MTRFEQHRRAQVARRTQTPLDALEHLRAQGQRWCRACRA